MRKIREILAGPAVLAAIGAVGVLVALGSAMWASYRTSQREAAIFASLSATAFEQGFCDRALRLAVVGLPPMRGASPLSFSSTQLQGELLCCASKHDCYSQFALAGHTSLVNSAVFSADGTRVVTSSWDGTARVWD